MSKYVKNFFRCLMDCKASITKSKNIQAGKVWLMVKDFACKGEYSGYRKAGTLAELTINGYSDTYIAAKLEINEGTVRVHRREISNELFRLFGDDFLALLADYSNNVEEVEKRTDIVRNFNVHASDLIALEILEIANSYEFEPVQFKLSDCQDEIRFLKTHSRKEIRNNLKNLDINKLHYLISILDNSEGTPSDRCALLSIMS